MSNLSAGSHNANELNVNFTIQFTLVTVKPSSNYVEIAGSSITINPVVFASDASTLGLVQWLIDVVTRLLAFLLGLNWTTQPDDIYLQPVQVTYNPITTTCNFANQGLVVTLPPSVSVPSNQQHAQVIRPLISILPVKIFWQEVMHQGISIFSYPAAAY